MVFVLFVLFIMERTSANYLRTGGVCVDWGGFFYGKKSLCYHCANSNGQGLQRADSAGVAVPADVLESIALQVCK
ncbi:hypothetical protein [Herbaspirillum sp. meg3]|jgi:hypothetical protein|uniref:hypothetical protein n=1 Tax=Herbaspirillum sp. meg3 TaxID=2025949 RepID=UPI0018DFD5E4|nr:hypothetical protein [Herbaspirillum sp. meg3]